MNAAGRASHLTGDNAGSRPRVAVVCAGLGGIQAAGRLTKWINHLTPVDRRNYHLFQPLLYRAATDLLQAARIAVAVQNLRSRRGLEVADATTGVLPWKLSGRKGEMRIEAEQKRSSRGT